MNNKSSHRLYWVLLVLLMGSLILAACGNGGGGGSGNSSSSGTTDSPAATSGDTTTASGAPEDGILRIGLRFWPSILDPQKASYTQEIAVLLLNYEGLTRLNEKLETIPGAAESWEYNEDSTAITFKLRENLTYSDGTPLTAQDYVNAVYRTLDPENPGYYQTTLDMITGANDVIEGTGTFENVGVKAEDDTTLSFTFDRPTPYFHTLTSMIILFPARQSLIEQGGDTWYEQAEYQLGNGPFQITNIDVADQTIEFEANENYWQGRPTLNGLRLIAIEDMSAALLAYKNGELDIISQSQGDIAGIKADPVLGQELIEFSGGCTEFYAFNPTTPPFDTKQVREAFAYAFDRESFIRDALNGSGVKTLTWIPPGYPGYDADEQRYDYDPEKAKQLLAEAGYPNGEGLPPVIYTYDNTSASIRPTVEYMVQMLQNNLGITIQAEPVDGDTFFELLGSVDTHPPFVHDSWCADYPDPQNWLSTYWHSKSGIAETRAYHNDEVDELIDQADVETDPATRIELYKEAQRLLIGDAVMILRSNNVNAYLIKPYVKGLERTPQDVEVPGSQTGLLHVTMESP